jgi:chromosome segregation ATPase
MKKVLNLQELINLQHTIESVINDLTYTIIVNNAMLKDRKDDYEDVKDLRKKYDTLHEQLIIIKKVKDKANRKKTSLKLTNQELVYELSYLRRKEDLLEKMYENKKKNRKGKKQDAYEFQISKEDIDTDLQEVKERISEIKDAMTKFNNSTSVKIQYFEELELL